MRVDSRGTRGSIAKPGPTTVGYGGNIACVEVRSAAGTWWSSIAELGLMVLVNPWWPRQHIPYAVTC